jgi:phospholipid-binding lipoprotein MlaA
MMPRLRFLMRPRLLAAASTLVLAGALAGCSPAPPGVEIWDPFEDENRARHRANLDLDDLIAGEGEGGLAAFPAPLRRGAANFAANAGGPADVLNYLLQGRPAHAAGTTLRFVLNSTVGLAGLFDPATALGMEGRRTDFGETLHVWGAPEGAYLELPLLGPSTERDAFGMIVDLAIDPLNTLRPPGLRNRALVARTGARGLARIGDRVEYSEMFDALIGESADSYAQARLLYLQNRRFVLGGEASIPDFDPYEDLHGD